MSNRPTIPVLSLLAALSLLSACGERPQELGRSGVKRDAAPYSGVGNSAFAQSGWKAGDRNGWEQQLRTRAQNGQNDYSRMASH